MRYRIEYADGRCCNFANGRADLLEWLKLLERKKSPTFAKCIKVAYQILFFKHTGVISVQHKEGHLWVQILKN